MIRVTKRMLENDVHRILKKYMGRKVNPDLISEVITDFTNYYKNELCD